MIKLKYIIIFNTYKLTASLNYKKWIRFKRLPSRTSKRKMINPISQKKYGLITGF